MWYALKTSDALLLTVRVYWNFKTSINSEILFSYCCFFQYATDEYITSMHSVIQLKLRRDPLNARLVYKKNIRSLSFGGDYLHYD